MKQAVSVRSLPVRILPGGPVGAMTTLRVGPIARRVITCTSAERVVAALRHLDSAAKTRADRPLVFAGGSNLVIAENLTDPDRGAVGQ